LIFFSVLGGVSVFGFLGLFIGPVIVAITTTLLAMLRDEGRTWMQGLRDESSAIAAQPDAACD
jgi:predicted PurR-regulated permease PerM